VRGSSARQQRGSSARQGTACAVTRHGHVSGLRAIELALLWVGVVGLGALITQGCSPAPSPSNAGTSLARGPSLWYRFPLPDGSSIGTDELSGRSTVVLFLTTYDPVSQAIALRLDAYQHTHAPRINVLAVALEPPQNAPLVAVYRETLGIGFPVALADQDTFDGRGCFGDVRAVPALVLLDSESRLVRRGVGVSAFAEIEGLLNRSATKDR